MDKVSVIQALIDAKKSRFYLEIGVASGDCFLKINARNKIAVDPAFTIPFKKKLKRHVKRLKSVLKKDLRVSEYFYRMPSDEFFESQSSKLLKNGVDVAFVDGLHTHKQSLRDVENCLRFLRDDGIIVVHDCNPVSSAAAYPAISYEEAREANPEGWTGEWSGDVWKTIPYLRATRDDLSIFVFDCDCGLGIIRKKGSPHSLDCDAKKIQAMHYGELAKKREHLLNLKPPSCFSSFIRAI